MALVSVIIPTHNRAQRVLRAVRSVRDQSFRDMEIIVVDDGSVDQTATLLRDVDPRVEVIRHPRRRGVSAARNTGIRRSGGSLIAFLDSDDRWLPRKLDVQVAFFVQNLEAGACQTEEIWIRRGKRVNPGRKHQKPSGDIFLRSLRLCVVSPSAVMLRRDVLDKVGLFDESLPVCEDYDLWLRIARRFPIYLIDDRLVVKEGGHSDQLSTSYPAMDRFRIRALLKLLRTGPLTSEQERAVHEELDYKCKIYGEGCVKRGRKEEGEFYLGLPRRIRKGSAAPAHIACGVVDRLRRNGMQETRDEGDS